jgi:hypothetical protein
MKMCINAHASKKYTEFWNVKANQLGLNPRDMTDQKIITTECVILSAKR